MHTHRQLEGVPDFLLPQGEELLHRAANLLGRAKVQVAHAVQLLLRSRTHLLPHLILPQPGTRMHRGQGGRMLLALHLKRRCQLVAATCLRRLVLWRGGHGLPVRHQLPASLLRDTGIPMLLQLLEAVLICCRLRCQSREVAADGMRSARCLRTLELNPTQELRGKNTDIRKLN